MAKTIVCSPDQNIRIGEWVYERTGGTFVPQLSQCIGLEKDGELVAGAVFEGWNGASVKGHLAVANKYGMNRDFMRFCFSYVFDQLEAKKLIGLVESDNVEAIKLDLHFGYQLEGVLRDASPNGDLLLFTMTREQCRVLKD